MSRAVVLDADLLGLVAQRHGIVPADACRQWIAAHVAAGTRLVVPSIADFEVRRELIRMNHQVGIARLDTFNTAAPDRYEVLTDAALQLAAQLWAQARNRGTPTGDPRELDCDVLIAEQALSLGVPPADLLVATSNVGHLAQFVTADLWSNVLP